MKRTALIAFALLVLGSTSTNAASAAVPTKCPPNTHYMASHWGTVGNPPHRKWIAAGCIAVTTHVSKGTSAAPASPKP